MSSRTILVCIFCSLISNATMANEFNRETIQINLPIENLAENIIEKLDQIGIVLDEESNISIHEEKSSVNLTCFNCIVRNVNSENHVRGARNEEITK